MEENNEETTRTEVVRVSIEQIKVWLKNGVTRRVGDPNYNSKIGSIQEKYNMTKTETTSLFQDSRLKGLKVYVQKPSRILIMEDEAMMTTPIPSDIATLSEDSVTSELHSQEEESMVSPDGEEAVQMESTDGSQTHESVRVAAGPNLLEQF